jgi:hypothetical protein
MNRVSISVLATFLAATPSLAQTSAFSIPASAFDPLTTGTAYDSALLGGNLCRFRTGGGAFFEAPLHLPTGTSIEAIEVRFCDSSPTDYFRVYLTTNTKSGTIAHAIVVDSTNAEAPGCVNSKISFASPLTVDNGTSTYSLQAQLNATGTPQAICAAWVYYKRQVSPAPATATFGDVPVSHAFHQFVEALAAAGISGGCGSGNFCPDAPLTRGQMAVFLSVALGLHWPN